MKTNKNIEQDFDNWSLRVGLTEDEENHDTNRDTGGDVDVETTLNNTISSNYINPEPLNVNYDVNIEDNYYENFTAETYHQGNVVVEQINRDELIRQQRSEMFYEECKEIAYNISSYIFCNKNNSHLIEHYISDLLNVKRTNNKIGECEFYREANSYNIKIKIISLCGNYFYSFEIPYF